jgi:hypothetical protein
MFWECYVENKLDYKEAWKCSKTQKQALPGATENMVRLLRCQMVGQEPRSAEEELGWLQGSGGRDGPGKGGKRPGQPAAASSIRS